VKAYNEDGREFIRQSAMRMKEWHDTQKQIELPSKKTNVHKNKKRRSPPPKEVVPVPSLISHFVMNLPATAIEFLGTNYHDSDLMVDAFRGLYKGKEELFQPHTAQSLPMIHVYCFQNPTVAEESILKEIREALGYEIQQSALSIHNVRNVSPNKVSHIFECANRRICIVVRLDFRQK